MLIQFLWKNTCFGGYLKKKKKKKKNLKCMRVEKF